MCLHLTKSRSILMSLEYISRDVYKSINPLYILSYFLLKKYEHAYFDRQIIPLNQQGHRAGGTFNIIPWYLVYDVVLL